jgi:hypothetical protein
VGAAVRGAKTTDLLIECGKDLQAQIKKQAEKTVNDIFADE